MGYPPHLLTQIYTLSSVGGYFLRRRSDERHLGIERPGRPSLDDQNVQPPALDAKGLLDAIVLDGEQVPIGDLELGGLFLGVPASVPAGRVSLRLQAGYVVRRWPTLLTPFCLPRWTPACGRSQHRSRRVAVHLRGRRKGVYTTDSGHMPDHHRAHLEWTPDRFRRWARGIGPETARLVEGIIGRRSHPEQAYRTCLGLMRLEREYGCKRFEAACHRAADIGGLSWSSVKSILKSGFDRLPLQSSLPLDLPQQHSNVRGPDYYRGDKPSHTNPNGD